MGFKEFGEAIEKAQTSLSLKVSRLRTVVHHNWSYHCRLLTGEEEKTKRKARSTPSNSNQKRAAKKQKK